MYKHREQADRERRTAPQAPIHPRVSGVGVQRRFGRYCSLYAGYRVLGISGIALADAQIPPFLIDSPVILDIDTNGSLIVHGGVFGLMWNY